MERPIFERGNRADAATFMATELARGPWDPEACHGGAPAALLAALIEATPAATPMQTVRLTFEIERPVPIGVPLHSGIEVSRDGRRVQVIDATLRTAVDTAQRPAGSTLVRCRAARIRAGDVPTPAGAAEDVPAPTPGPDALPPRQGLDGWDSAGFWDAVDVRFVEGQLLATGPAVIWTRLRHPIAAGVDTTPLARTAAAADFGNGISSPLPFDRFVYINPDLRVEVHRPAVGAWIGLAATTVAQPTGIGLTSATLFDRDGRIGRASQSLFIDTRPAPDR